jgi:L-alanine-DL-glutamate epimerase-like enolase superfamily enzyme
MRPFTIATGTMTFAQNIFIRIHTTQGITGVGECSAFPMIVGETQDTCFILARDFSSLLKNKNALDVDDCMLLLNQYIAGNYTVKSAFDMALHDIAATHAGLPLYKWLGGTHPKKLETDITIGISNAEQMAAEAAQFIEKGFKILKVKVGKDPQKDAACIRAIREAVGYGISIRIDANQGWSYEQATEACRLMAPYQIAFCEQPMHRRHDYLLPELMKASEIPIMADESVFNYDDARQLSSSNSCHYVNIKLAKTGGILEAKKVHDICQEKQIPCMMGGMLESRVALTAFAHFATAMPNIVFYDMDTCMLGHLTDPVTNGAYFDGNQLVLPGGIGINADVDEDFLKTLESFTV